MAGIQQVKTLAVKEEIHAQIVECAETRGMTIQGLTERILRGWLDENFFTRKFANGNKRGQEKATAVKRAEARP